MASQQSCQHNWLELSEVDVLVLVLLLPSYMLVLV